MNKSDSERVAAVFEHLSYSLVEKMEQADFIVVNACSVRQTAIDRIWGIVKKCKMLKSKKELTTILTGCLLDEDKKSFQKKFDFVFNIKKLSELEKFLHSKQEYTSENYFDTLPKLKKDYLAYVPIMTGCNNYCSYCAVPYARGREVSRPVKKVVEEVKSLVASGVKEIHLLGQNVNSYNPSNGFSAENPFKQNFAKLLWEVDQIKDLKRIGFTSSHPKDLHDDVIQALALPKMINHLHLALQSGDNQILKKMNRKYTAEDFLLLIKKLRKIKPEITIGTDIIVGFPGETKEQFENTLKLYEKLRLDISYHAMYSPRSGTKAAEFKDDVSYEEKKRRWHKIQTLVKKIALEINQKYLDKVVEVLIDKVTTRYAEGNSLEMKRVRVKNDNVKVGDLIKVKVNKAQEWLLYGELIK